jgi:proteasome lid subunit RPN8/RPN11
MMLEVPQHVIAETVEHLRQSNTSERVVLWLGRREQVVRILEVYVPLQHAASDYFRIPREGMSALLEYLRSKRLVAAAQVHTHPGRAFHSAADDAWALVRHEGALSFVVPRF